MDKIRFGIIGCGNHARKSFIPAVKKCNRAELAVIASRSSKQANDYAIKYNCDAVTGYSDLIARNDIDVVYISTPNALHVEWAIQAARAGKHVLCEKPLASNLNDTVRVIESCRKHDVAVMEGFAYQYHPQHSIFKELVDSGEIGEAKLFQAWFGFPPHPSEHRYDLKLGGGALLDAGTYTVHSSRMFYSCDPVKIYSLLDNKNYQVDVHGSVMLEFPDGKVAQLAFGFNNMYRNSYSVWGSKGIATITRAYSIPADLPPKIILEKQDQTSELVLEPFDQFVGEIDEFISGLQDQDKRKRWCDDALSQAIVVSDIRRFASGGV